MTRSLARGACLLGALALVAAPMSACAGQPAAELRERAAEALRSGEYDDARSMYEGLIGRPDAVPGDKRGLIAVLLETGALEDAERRAREFVASSDSAALLVSLGDVLMVRGNRVAADSAYRRAVAASSPDSLTARLRIALNELDRGERRAAYRELDRFIDVFNSAGPRRLTSAELVAVGTAVRTLGARDPQLFKDALTAYDAAIAADSLNWEPQLLVGELFLEKYNAPDARDAFEAVLAVNARHPRALTGVANVLVADGAPGAMELVDRALDVNPNYAPARALRARLLLDLEKYADARAEAERALAVDSMSAEGLAALAAATWLAADTAAYRQIVAASTRRLPGNADVFVLVGESAARSRLYALAAQIAGEGVARDSSSWRAYAVRGVNRMRIGQMASAREDLERAFAGDPYDVWTKNTLDLLDLIDRARVVRVGRFEFVLDSSDADLLPVYLAPLAEEAFDSLAKRYDYKPEGPVRIELFRTKADFSVRTIGLPGFGALGVSFGDVVAMNSPGARDAGAFNWGAVVWHELAHTFTLGASRHRVPRWLSEGLSVYEEHRARPGWGADVTPSFLAAFASGRLAPPSSLNDGFMRPKFPEQIILSYYQASLVCDMIAEQFGADALSRLVSAYGDGSSTAAAVKSVLGIELGELDSRFNAYVRETFASHFDAIRGGPVLPSGEGGAGALGRFGTQLTNAERALSSGDTTAAIAALQRAKTLFPEYTGPGSPYRILAQIHLSRRAHREAEQELAALVAIADDDYRAQTELANARIAIGDTAGAIAAFEQAMYISPYDAAVHTRVAELAEASRNAGVAVRERQALIALDPVDRAGAEYRLARAHLLAGDRTEARRAVLRALEQAPNYQEAQELLLELRSSPQGGAR